MNSENFETSDFIGAINQNLSIETARTQQGWIENFRAVCRGQQNYPCTGIESVQLRQKLIQGLLFFIMAAASEKRASSAPQRIQFIDEDNAGGFLSGLLEEVAYPRGADADEHFDKLRTAD